MVDMRVLAVIMACAACGGGHATTSDANGDGPPGEGLPANETLGARLSVKTIAAAAGVMAGDESWRVWGQGSLGVSPVYTVPGACGALVGYTTGSTSAPEARVAMIGGADDSDQLVETLDLGPYVVRGLAAEQDHFAALLWDPSQSPAALHVQRFPTSGGVPGWSTDLVDALAAPTDFGIGDSRLEYANGMYGAYYHVHGISGFANGHEGDQLEWLDASTGAMTTGWEWGCSHSTSAQLRASGGAFLAACMTDCYPGTTGTNFATDSIGGVYLNNATKVLDVDAGCNGSVAGELGSLAPAASGWRLVWNSHQNAATHGQSSYDPATMNQDIAFAPIDAGATPGAVVWLTSTASIDESDPSIVRWQPSGDPAEQYIVGWNEAGTYKLARVSAAGAVLEGPVALPVKWGARDDPFRADPAADVVWAWFDSPGDTSFHFVRLSARNGNCSTI